MWTLSRKLKRILFVLTSTGLCAILVLQLCDQPRSIDSVTEASDLKLVEDELSVSLEVESVYEYYREKKPVERDSSLNVNLMSSSSSSQDDSLLENSRNFTKESDEQSVSERKRFSLESLLYEAFVENRLNINLVRDEVSRRYHIFVNETNNFGFLKKPPHRVRHFGLFKVAAECSSPTTLIIMVSSGVNNTIRRNLIRSTWGARATSWRTIFVLGRSIDAVVTERVAVEMLRYKDIIVGDFVDDFNMLSYKIEVGFVWIHENCQYEYLLKTDDDVFVDAEMVSFYARLFYFKELYAGTCQDARAVIRIGYSKYNVPVEEYPYDFFPAYCSGGGILLSGYSVSQMILYFSDARPVSMEDAYVGILAHRAGIPHRSIPGFLGFNAEERCNTSCYADEQCFADVEMARQSQSEQVSAVMHEIPNVECMFYYFNLNLYKNKKKNAARNGL